MSALQDYIKQITDEALRQNIQREVDRLLQNKKFGLVFENHQPEYTPLWGVGIAEQCTVARKAAIGGGALYTVVRRDARKAWCLPQGGGEVECIFVDELVRIASFGEAIYPCLQRVDTIERAPESSLWHTLIEADNYHALQLLEYLYAGKVDCIYIDPPYNTGAKDWKYNNDYVDGSDAWRHSKWLAMMERRLKLAKKLLSPSGVMIAAIDDYENARFTQLIEEIFLEYDVNTVIINHHPQGGAADNISRTHEYALFVTPKGLKIVKGNRTEDVEERWSLTRGGTDIRNLRAGRPNSFYAIYVEKSTKIVKDVGPHLDADTPYDPDYAPQGCVALYPVGKDGTERVWRYERESMRKHIANGDIVCTDRMTLNVVKRRDVKYNPVFSLWNEGRYNAGMFGTNLLRDIFSGDMRFSYPKSLYTVFDCVRYSIHENPRALILDFFAGSGTTLHAVNLLNAEDGGQRRCILVTNNEVSADEEKALREKKLKPGDAAWEALGIARHVTWPRTVCSIRGENVRGEPLAGQYLGSGRDMAAGFAANAMYFKLGFLDKTSVALGQQFRALLPLLWMQAGAQGACPQLAEDAALPAMLLLPANGFAVLLAEKGLEALCAGVQQHEAQIREVFIVADSQENFARLASWFAGKTCHYLYHDYLENFRINAAKGENA